LVEIHGNLSIEVKGFGRAPGTQWPSPLAKQPQNALDAVDDYLKSQKEPDANTQNVK
jgi:hypothetical protein